MISHALIFSLRICNTPFIYLDENDSGAITKEKQDLIIIDKTAPKGKSFDAWSQHTVDKMMSHINSYNRNALYDKSPIDLFTSMFDKETLDLLNIKKIDPDLIDLSEKLIKDSGCEHE